MLPLLAVLLVAAPSPQIGPRTPGKGEETQTVTFSDAKTEHQVVFHFSHAEKDDTRSLRMRVQHDRRARGAKTWTKVWEAKDFVEQCELDAALDLLEPSITVSDVDGDGEPEFSFAYTLGCFSDVSPRDMKLLMYEGKTKYALRGQTKVIEAGEEYGGTFKADAAFEKAPKAFLEAAKTLWMKVMPVFDTAAAAR